MKAKYISCLMVLFLMIIFSCKKELEPQESSVVTNPSSDSSTPASPVTPPGANLKTMQNQPLSQPSSNQNTSGMNPPHGQAGHRCDIAVGAPLNSTPNKIIPNPARTNTVSNSPAPMVVKPNAATYITKPGMNPPHGQTGHRCDIAVGAPLNSPATKVVPPPAVTNSQVPAVLNLDTTATTPK